ncbi:MAG: hypothetical protein ACXAEJ_15520 [Candidatus Thorarchaeota archaeon]
MDPFMFVIVCLSFFVLFIAFMYSKRLLWFQHADTTEPDNWVATFYAKDLATGSWCRRFAVPAAAFYLLLSVLYPVMMNFLELASFQRLIFIMFYFPSILVVGIFFLVMLTRINRHVLEPAISSSGP